MLSSASETSETCHGTPPDRSKRSYRSSSPEPTSDRPRPPGRLRGRDNRRSSSRRHPGCDLGDKDYRHTTSQNTGPSQSKRARLPASSFTARGSENSATHSSLSYDLLLTPPPSPAPSGPKSGIISQAILAATNMPKRGNDGNVDVVSTPEKSTRSGNKIYPNPYKHYNPPSCLLYTSPSPRD